VAVDREVHVLPGAREQARLIEALVGCARRALRIGGALDEQPAQRDPARVRLARDRGEQVVVVGEPELPAAREPALDLGGRQLRDRCVGRGQPAPCARCARPRHSATAIHSRIVWKRSRL
jgi:hypothetical protein